MCTRLLRSFVVLLVAASGALLMLPGASLAAARAPVEMRDIRFGAAGGSAARLDVTWRPGARGRPVLVLVHGGGWRVGQREQWKANGWTLPWVRAGYVVVTPSYRLACGAEEAARLQLDARLCGATMADARADAVAAVRWSVRNARRFGGDGSKVVLVGASAGAQLALLASVDPTVAAKVRGVVALSPPADLPSVGRAHGWLAGALTASIRCAWRDCPSRWLGHSPHAVLARVPRRRIPPVYLFSSRRDVRVPWTGVQSLAAMLDRRRVPVALREPAVRMANCHGPWACERYAVAGTRRALKADVLAWLRSLELTPPPPPRPARPAARA